MLEEVYCILHPLLYFRDDAYNFNCIPLLSKASVFFKCLQQDWCAISVFELHNHYFLEMLRKCKGSVGEIGNTTRHTNLFRPSCEIPYACYHHTICRTQNHKRHIVTIG